MVGHAPNVVVQEAPTFLEEIALVLAKCQSERLSAGTAQQPRLLMRHNDELDTRINALLDKLQRMGVCK